MIRSVGYDLPGSRAWGLEAVGVEGSLATEGCWWLTEPLKEESPAFAADAGGRHDK